ncbi:MAG: hypothetical protein O7J95_18465 [Planctomycetota bacterium]|nr:hypothetical protein [Planctomycetota bacterium]
MRALLVTASAALAILALPVGIVAAGDEKGDEKKGARAKNARRRPHERAVRLFKSLDKNGDGILGAEEIPADRRAFFDRLVKVADADKNGKLSQAEFAKGLTTSQRAPGRRGEGGRRPQARQAFDPKRFVQRVDKNGDGKVTLEEVPEQARGYVRRLIKNADKDGDGAVTADELAKVRPAQGQRPRRPGQPQARAASPAMAVFRLLDTDGDGQLSKQEVNRLVKLVKSADKNKDGNISRQELTAAMTRKAPTNEKGKRKRGPGKTAAGKAGGANVAARTLRRLDKNGDSVISREEAKGRLAKRFDQVDANADGKLDEGELTNALGRAAGKGGKKSPDKKKGTKKEKPQTKSF